MQNSCEGSNRVCAVKDDGYGRHKYAADPGLARTVFDRHTCITDVPAEPNPFEGLGKLMTERFGVRC